MNRDEKSLIGVPALGSLLKCLGASSALAMERAVADTFTCYCNTELQSRSDLFPVIQAFWSNEQETGFKPEMETHFGEVTGF